MSSINSKVPPPRLSAVDTPTDGQIPSYQASSGEFEWVDSSGGSPGGSADEIQYNDGAGAFAGDAGFKIQTEGGGSSTKIRVGDIFVGSTIDAAVQAEQDGNLRISPEGSGELTLTSNNDAGGTMTDMKVNITAQSASDDPILQFGNLSAHTGELRLDGGTGDFIVTAEGADKDLDLKVNGTGQVEVQNTTTNNDTTFSVKGNGTGTPKLSLSNDTKSASLEVTTNNEMTVKGATNSFKFDVSSATGAMTFPDGTTQNTAASGSPTISPYLGTEVSGSSYERYRLALQPFYSSGTDNSNFTVSNLTRVRYFPFIAAASGDVSEIGIYCAASSTNADINVGIYSSTTGGKPDSLMGYATIDISSTGDRYQTIISDTITLVAGTQYFYALGVDDLTAGGTIRGIDSSSVPDLGVGSNTGNSGRSTSFRDSFTSTSLPSTATNFNYRETNRIYVSIKLT